MHQLIPTARKATIHIITIGHRLVIDKSIRISIRSSNILRTTRIIQRNTMISRPKENMKGNGEDIEAEGPKGMS